MALSSRILTKQARTPKLTAPQRRELARKRALARKQALARRRELERQWAAARAAKPLPSKPTVPAQKPTAATPANVPLPDTPPPVAIGHIDGPPVPVYDGA